MNTINNPVDVEALETEPQAEQKTIEQLETELKAAQESLVKVEANRNEILREKRAKLDAQNAVSGELEALKIASQAQEKNFKEYIHNNMVNSFIEAIAMPNSDALWRELLKDRIRVDVLSNKFEYTDKDGNPLSLEGLAATFEKTHPQYMRGVNSSGGGAIGSNCMNVGGNSSRVKSKAFASQFGLGK